MSTNHTRIFLNLLLECLEISQKFISILDFSFLNNHHKILSCLHQVIKEKGYQEMQPEKI